MKGHEGGERWLKSGMQEHIVEKEWKNKWKIICLMEA
jgi:hypothetical protein